MRRAGPALAVTVGVVALIMAFHTTPEPSGATVRPPGLSTTAPPSPTTLPDATGPVPTTRSSPTTTARTGSHDGVFTGSGVDVRYGFVRVQVTVRGDRIVDVEALELPSDRPRSERISEEAGPMLRSEALQAQSGNIDLVSGATYTSEGYKESLQAALDSAGFGN